MTDMELRELSLEEVADHFADWLKKVHPGGAACSSRCCGAGYRPAPGAHFPDTDGYVIRKIKIHILKIKF